jgi:hypothetical protein
MKITNKMPKDGQFIAVWKYQGKVWSEVLRYHEGELQKYTVDLGEDSDIVDTWVSSYHPYPRVDYLGYITLE